MVSTDLKVGDRVKVVADTSSDGFANHGVPIGTVLNITKVRPELRVPFECELPDGKTKCFAAAEVELFTEEPKEAPQVNAVAILEDAASVLRERGKSRDSEQGERSMARAVRIFNDLTGQSLTEEEGWKFMIALKFSRMAAGKFHFDDYIDTVGYSALLAECAANDNLKKGGK